MTLSPALQLHTYSADIALRDSCHLWLLDTDQLTEEEIEQQRDLLSADELARVHLLKRRQLQFIAIRALVRKCLALYSGMPPRDLVLATESQGKPFLANTELPLKFNLSHCNNKVVLAVGLQDEIGVDIETSARKRNQRNIAARYFHRDEFARLAALDDSHHSEYFYRLWTLKEAFFKAIGTGISAGLDKAAFYWQGETIRIKLANDLQVPSDHWQFYQTFICSDYCVALARRSEQANDIHWFDARQLFIRQPNT